MIVHIYFVYLPTTRQTIRKILFFKWVELILEKVVTIILCVVSNFATENLLITNYLSTLSIISMWMWMNVNKCTANKSIQYCNFDRIDISTLLSKHVRSFANEEQFVNPFSLEG